MEKYSCKQCNVELDLSITYFHKSKSNLSGLSHICKECRLLNKRIANKAKHIPHDITPIDGEIWVDINGFEDYMISNNGRVMSKERTCLKMSNGKSVERAVYKRLLKPQLSKIGYYLLVIAKGNKKHSLKLHRLICNAFIPNPDNKPFVNHINGIKTDNSLSNLEWCTPKENVNHAFDTGLNIKPQHGEKNPNSKLTSLQVLEIRLLGLTHKYSDIAKQYNVDAMTIAAIVKRKSWTNI